MRILKSSTQESVDRKSPTKAKGLVGGLRGRGAIQAGPEGQGWRLKLSPQHRSQRL